jgi:DNA-binding CsgD family transcriptional regulator
VPPFEAAWSYFVEGRLLRRAKQKRAAAGALGQAVERFDQIGAPMWAARARRELDRVGLRRAPPGELTASESRVAELAASGLTNREIAQGAFMSVKTVEANLARVYRKFGIHSRAELGARMAGGRPQT